MLSAIVSGALAVIEGRRPKMNDVDPQAWLADVLAQIAEHPVHKLDELLPWNWQPAYVNQAA